MDELHELADSLAAADPTDAETLGRFADRLVQLRRDLRRGQDARARQYLDAALLLLTYIRQMGRIGGSEVSEVVARLLVAAHAASMSKQADSAEGALPAVHAEAQVRADADVQAIDDVLLGEILIRWGEIDADEVAAALEIQEKSGMRFGEALVKSGATTWPRVEDALRYQDRCRQVNGGAGEPAPPAPIKSGGMRKLERSAKGEPSAEAENGLRLVSDLLLGEILLRQGRIAREQLDEAVRLHRATGLRIGEALVQSGAARWADIEYGIQLQGQMRKYA